MIWNGLKVIEKRSFLKNRGKIKKGILRTLNLTKILTTLKEKFRETVTLPTIISVTAYKD